MTHFKVFDITETVFVINEFFGYAGSTYAHRPKINVQRKLINHNERTQRRPWHDFGIFLAYKRRPNNKFVSVCILFFKCK